MKSISQTLGQKLRSGLTAAVVCVMGLITAPSWALHSDTILPKDRVMDMVITEALRQNFDPALALAVAKVESDFRTHVESHKGARGVMQIMPATARGEFGLAPARLYDPQTNISTGILFLKHLIETYGRVDIALSHYNGGSAVRRYDGSLRVIPATRGYVTKVLQHARDFRAHPRVANLRSGVGDSTWVSLDSDNYGPYAANPRVDREQGELVVKLQALRSEIDRRFDLKTEPPLVVPSGVSGLQGDRAARLREWRRW